MANGRPFVTPAAMLWSMAIPAGMITRTIETAPICDALGKPIAGAKATLISERSPVWAANGQTFLATPLEALTDSLGVARWLSVPSPAQDGWTDGASGIIRDWTLTVSVATPPRAPDLPDVTFIPDGTSGTYVVSFDTSLLRSAGTVSTVDVASVQRAENAANRAVEAADSIEKDRPGGVAGLTSEGLLQEGQLPLRLGSTALDLQTVNLIGQTTLNVQYYGILPGGDPATNAAGWTALVNDVQAPGSKTRGIYFPGSAGAYVLPVGAIFSKTVRVYSDAADAAILQVAPGSVGDFLRFRTVRDGGGAVVSTARWSSVEGITIDGNKAGGALGDLIVLDCGYATIDSAYLINAGGTAIRVGKNERAIAANLHNVLMRTNLDYGILVQQDSTDGLWSDVDVGTSGLSGIKIEASAQNTTNLHVWGNGSRYVAGDSSGILIVSSGHQMSNLQAESNWEYGVSFVDNDQNGTYLAAPKSWANGWGGYNVQNYSRLTMSGWGAYDNGLRNGAPTDGALATGTDYDPRYAGVRNFESNHLVLTGGRSHDRQGARSFDAPSPKIRRPAIRTQVWDYVETGTSFPSLGAISGNSFLAPSPGGVSMMGNGTTFEGNRVPNTTIPTVVMSGTTLQVRANHKLVNATGTGTINSLGTDSIVGRIVTVLFSATGITVSDGSTSGRVKLVGGAFASDVGKQITVQWNGVLWVEIARL